MSYNKLEFSRSVNFTGRNGYFKQKGLSMYFDANQTADSVVTLVPITSKGADGHCGIDIPMQQLPDVIKALANMLTDKGYNVGKEVLEECGLLMSGLWHLDDVRGKAKEMGVELTDDEVAQVLAEVGHDFDAEHGISWFNIENRIQLLIENKEIANG